MATNSMDLKDWINSVTLEDIPEVYRPWAEEIGTEALLKLAKYLGGNTLYFPKIDCLIQSARDRLIIQEYESGAKIKDLTTKYDITDSWVRRIIDQYLTKRDQLELFEKVV